MGSAPCVEKTQKIDSAYRHSQQMAPLFNGISQSGSGPIFYQESIYEGTHAYPFCCIGLLTGVIHQRQVTGIASIIDEHYLLTTAQNCYSLQKDVYTSNMKFSIQSNRNGQYQQFSVSKTHIPEKYKTSRGKQKDLFNFALLEINDETSFEDNFGTLGIDLTSAFENVSLLGAKCYINYHKMVIQNKISFKEYLSFYPTKIIKGNYDFGGLSGVPILRNIKQSYLIAGLTLTAEKGCQYSSKILILQQYVSKELTSEQEMIIE